MSQQQVGGTRGAVQVSLDMSTPMDRNLNVSALRIQYQVVDGLLDVFASPETDATTYLRDPFDSRH